MCIGATSERARATHKNKNNQEITAMHQIYNRAHSLRQPKTSLLWDCIAALVFVAGIGQLFI